MRRQLRSAAIVFLLTGMALAANETLPELKARADAAHGGEQAKLCLEYARRILEDANALFTDGDVDKAQSEISEVVEYAHKAADAASSSGKHLKANRNRVAQAGQAYARYCCNPGLRGPPAGAEGGGGDRTNPLRPAGQNVRAASRTEGETVMLRTTQWLVGLIFLLCFVAPVAAAQTRDRDPLNEKEIDADARVGGLSRQAPGVDDQVCAGPHRIHRSIAGQCQETRKTVPCRSTICCRILLPCWMRSTTTWTCTPRTKRTCAKA